MLYITIIEKNYSITYRLVTSFITNTSIPILYSWIFNVFKYITRTTYRFIAINCDIITINTWYDWYMSCIYNRTCASPQHI